MKRRTFLTGLAGLGGALVTARAPAQTRIEPVPLDEGRYTQSWFLNSFLTLKDDLADAAAQGKRFAILWDQRGCPYCQEMHRVNFADPAVNNFIRERFSILQLDLFGSREVTDFDGRSMSEKDLARRYAIAFTPTIQFLPADVAGVESKTVGRSLEVARMPGYFRPGHFEAMFAFVHERAYERGSFQAYLKQRNG
jgi:thioredoxin-related protein